MGLLSDGKKDMHKSKLIKPKNNGRVGFFSFHNRLGWASPDPPLKPPEIFGYNPGQVFTHGELYCNVSGGKPLVKKVNFSCSSDISLEDQQDTIEGSSLLSYLTIKAKESKGYSMVCVCGAHWEPNKDLYIKTSSITVFVDNDDQGNTYYFHDIAKLARAWFP